MCRISLSALIDVGIGSNSLERLHNKLKRHIFRRYYATHNNI